jgi:hypothetical protein
VESILDLPGAYEHLSPEQRQRFDSLFSFSLDTGRLVVPEAMRPWATQQFGSYEKLEEQAILRVTNKVSLEGALFNRLRAERPMQRGAPVDRGELLATAAKEPFADVMRNTPEDTFGRIRGKHETTASNVAKSDALHGVVVFDNADPLAFTEEETVSHFNTALAWIGAAHLHHRDAVWPAIGWNCLWKAAASLVHGHLQVLLAKEPYAAMLANRRNAEEYERKFGKGYWDELFNVHKELGLGAKKEGVKCFSHLTPKKEKEVLLISDAADERLFGAIFRVLAALRDDLGVESFNLAMLLPPLGGAWPKFPVVTRIVDRGSLATRTGDLAFIELYLGDAVVASDPVKVWEAVKRRL